MTNILSILKALSDQNRLRIVLSLMTYDELCACQITEFLQISGATVSRHLGVLANADIVKSRKDGRWVYFKLKRNKNVEQVLTWLESSLAQDEIFMQDNNALKAIMACDPEDICRKQRGESCCPKKKPDTVGDFPKHGD